MKNKLLVLAIASAMSTMASADITNKIGVGFFMQSDLKPAYTENDAAAFAIDGVIAMNDAMLTNGITDSQMRAVFLREYTPETMTASELTTDTAVTRFNTLWPTIKGQLGTATGAVLFQVLGASMNDDKHAFALVPATSDSDDWANNGYKFGSLVKLSQFNSVANAKSVEQMFGHAAGMGNNIGNTVNANGTTAYAHGLSDCGGKGTIMSDAAQKHNFFSDPRITVNTIACGNELTENNAKVLLDSVTKYAAMNGALTLPTVTLLAGDKDTVDLNAGESVTLTLTRSSSAGDAWAAYKVSSTSNNITPSKTTAKVIANDVNGTDLTSVNYDYDFTLVKFSPGELSKSFVVPTKTTGASSDTTVATVTVIGAIGLDAGGEQVTLNIKDTDKVPDAFSFPSKTGVKLNTATISDKITITGADFAGATITVQNGEYSIGCDTTKFVSTDTTIASGTTVDVCVRHTSSQDENGSVTTTLTVAGVSGTFTSTTGEQSGGGSFSLVFGLFGLLAAGRRQWKR